MEMPLFFIQRESGEIAQLTLKNLKILFCFYNLTLWVSVFPNSFVIRIGAAEAAATGRFLSSHYCPIHACNGRCTELTSWSYWGGICQSCRNYNPETRKKARGYQVPSIVLIPPLMSLYFFGETAQLTFQAMWFFLPSASGLSIGLV